MEKKRGVDQVLNVVLEKIFFLVGGRGGAERNRGEAVVEWSGALPPTKNKSFFPEQRSKAWVNSFFYSKLAKNLCSYFLRCSGKNHAQTTEYRHVWGCIFVCQTQKTFSLNAS